MKHLFLFCLIALSYEAAMSQTWSASGSNLYYTGGNVGIGTSTPNFPLHVVSSGGAIAYFQASGTGNSAITVLNGTAQMNLGIGSSTPHPYTWSGSGSYFIGNDGNPTVFVKGMGGGNVGINTTNPTFNLDVNGSVHANNIVVFNQASSQNAALWLNGQAGADASMIIQGGNEQAWWLTGSNGVLRIGGNGGTPPSLGVINIDVNGNMAVGGNTASNYKLDVYGNLRANEVVVNTSGADFVFDPGYRRPSLPELESYIKANHHLPQVAPAAQMQEQGLGLGANQILLLQKVEELTLYIIDQNKQIATQSKQLDEQNERMARQDRQLEQLQAEIDQLKTAKQH